MYKGVRVKRRADAMGGSETSIELIWDPLIYRESSNRKDYKANDNVYLQALAWCTHSASDINRLAMLA